MIGIVLNNSILKKVIPAICVALTAAQSFAERPDSISLPEHNETLPSYMIPSSEPTPDNISPDSDQETGLGKSSYKDLLLNRYNMTPLPSFKDGINLSPDIASWQGGGLYASGLAADFPGLMGIENGRINISHTIGNLSMTAWGEATKYGYFRELQTSYGFGASITYRFSDRWSLTAFGSYSTPLHPLTPAMAGLMSSTHIGGYASYNINDRWGVSVGAQATHALVTNRWEAQPIVMPYYRINKDVSIGVDVGGIIYNIAKDYLDNRNAGNGSGVPPRPVSPPRPIPNR